MKKYIVNNNLYDLFEQISEVLGVSLANSRILLQKFAWKAEKIMNMFFDCGLEQVLKSADISTESITLAVTDVKEFTCPLCYDDYFSESITTLPCGHCFCNYCWKTQIELKIKVYISIFEQKVKTFELGRSKSSYQMYGDEM